MTFAQQYYPPPAYAQQQPFQMPAYPQPGFVPFQPPGGSMHLPSSSSAATPVPSSERDQSESEPDDDDEEQEDPSDLAAETSRDIALLHPIICRP